MPTLQELFENDLGASSVKTASEATALEPSLEKIATELGLFGEVGAVKTAAEENTKEDEGKEDEGKKKEGEEKEASQQPIGSLFDTMFPGENPVGAVKTAEDEKVAAYEEALGGRSYEHFHSRLNARIEKMASTLGTTGSVHEGTEPPQAFPTNHADRAEGGQAIDTKPEITDEVKAKNDKKTVGHFEQKTAGFDEAQVKVMEEMYANGHDKIAAAFADEVDSMDKVAEEKKEDEEKLDEESEKAASECGAFIEKGFVDGLRKLGQERHSDPDFYFYPLIENKVAEVGAAVALNKFAGKLSEIGKKIQEAAKTVGSKAKDAGSAVKGYHKGAIADISKGIKGGDNMGKADRAKSALKGAAKLSPYAVLGGAAAYKATKKD